MIKFGFLFNLLRLGKQDSFLTTLVRKLIAIFEKYRILFFIKTLKYKKIIIPFDCKHAPGTVGDFINLIHFSRIIGSYNLKVEFVLITGEFRHNWIKRYDKKGIKKHIQHLRYLTNKISPKNTKFSEMNWDQFNNRILKQNFNKTFIMFKNKVKKRRPIYTHVPNMINYFLYNNYKAQKYYLFNKKEINKKVKSRIPTGKYLTIGCRHEPPRIGNTRSLSSSQFIKIIRLLNKHYPYHAKVVIGNKYGCDYFKKISKKYSLNCKFSKDFSPNHIGDGKIILNSDAFFQIDGSIMNYAENSNLPFLIANGKASNPHDYLWSKSRNIERCYHKPNQLFYRNGESSLFFKKFHEFKLKNPQIK